MNGGSFLRGTGLVGFSQNRMRYRKWPADALGWAATHRAPQLWPLPEWQLQGLKHLAGVDQIFRREQLEGRRTWRGVTNVCAGIMWTNNCVRVCVGVEQQPTNILKYMGESCQEYERHLTSGMGLKNNNKKKSNQTDKQADRYITQRHTGVCSWLSICVTGFGK